MKSLSSPPYSLEKKDMRDEMGTTAPREALRLLKEELGFITSTPSILSIRSTRSSLSRIPSTMSLLSLMLFLVEKAKYTRV